MGDSDTDSSDPDSEEAQKIGAEMARDQSDLVTVITHFYRAEVERVVTWRTRFDEPSYWAVTVMAALLVWAFSSFDTPHYILLIGMVTLLMFAFIEAHRYRTYDIWRSRVRLLQENFFADAFDPSVDIPENEWRRKLSTDLQCPTLKITFWQALARRLKRIYLPLLVVLLAGWLFRITVFTPDENWIASAQISTIPGMFVVGSVVLFYGILFGIAIKSRPGKVQGEFHGETETWKNKK